MVIDCLFLAGQIGYALAPMVARGVALGPDQPVILHLLDIPPASQALEGVRMELVDAAYPLLKGMLNCQQNSPSTAVTILFRGTDDDGLSVCFIQANIPFTWLVQL